jgi:hypothetical protein
MKFACLVGPDHFQCENINHLEDKTLKYFNSILALAMGAVLVLACSGTANKPANSNTGSDNKAQPAKSDTANTEAPKKSESTSDANVYTHKEGGIQFEVPNGWKATPNGDNMTVASADGGLQVVFWVPAEDSFDAAVRELDKEIGKTIKNVKTVGTPTKDTHNGMPHYGESGTGEVDGTTIAWSVDVLSAKKPVIILSFAAPNLYEKNSADYEKLINSIKKVS